MPERKGLLAVVQHNSLHKRGARSGCYPLETTEVPLRDRGGRLDLNADDLAGGVLQNEVDLKLLFIAIVKDGDPVFGPSSPRMKETGSFFAAARVG